MNKLLLFVIGIMFAFAGMANAGGLPIEGSSRASLFAPSGAAFLLAVYAMNDGEKLPCHSRPNVKVKADNGNYYYSETDCVVNGFK